MIPLRHNMFDHVMPEGSPPLKNIITKQGLHLILIIKSCSLFLLNVVPLLLLRVVTDTKKIEVTGF